MFKNNRFWPKKKKKKLDVKKLKSKALQEIIPAVKKFGRPFRRNFWRKHVSAQHNISWPEYRELEKMTKEDY